MNRIGIVLMPFALISLTVIGCVSQPRRDYGPVDQQIPSEFTTSSSGLRYRVLRASDGRRPKPTDTVVVDYSGWLDSGIEFDSSYERRKPTEFVLNEVIAGWTEGLQLIGEKGMIELEVPPELGYGSDGSSGKIPPDSTLHFRIELHKIK